MAKVEKMLIVSIGYNEYAIPTSKAQVLIDLLANAPRVHSPQYNHRYYLHADEQPVLNQVRLGEVTHDHYITESE